MQSKIVIAMLVIILASINYSIYIKELHLKQGTTIYLAIAPIDPRSLMQGDYMALHFEVANKLNGALPKGQGQGEWRDRLVTHDGKIIVTLDTNNIASYQTIYQGQVLQENELALNYRVRDNIIMFASNAFFFEEGSEEVYSQARYGEFKVNAQGELLLNAMFTKQLNLIKPE